ncbi:outer membrane lipoprotein-sorting protein (plasmid) [Vibrio sp. HDW18]|uniref:outer membrane lipoprotein-sorting protein n=1 Tax=Vibrio TaxID=662 RepID=UPI0014077C3B|nr:MULTISPECIES: outer membrane lipoprotein-sorting protein [unclassified Vibrio]QIL86630.1 outer membrane lipoprotein-sorting protein [Vibrio sp. HDW18]
MYKVILTLVLGLICSGRALALATELDVVGMVKRADEFRLKESAAKVVSVVQLYQDGKLEKTNQYDVYVRENRESLVLFQSATEAGQKMLMLGDNYWLLMPKSRRPIRITPMQKLLGEASVGDISTLTWSDDYQPSLEGEESVLREDQSSVETYRLVLKAKTAGASYQAITLWLNRTDAAPVKAELYLHSGKLAKVAWFTVQGERVVEMTLLDNIQPSKRTVIEYQSVQPKRLEDKFYNPAYLIQNPALE